MENCCRTCLNTEHLVSIYFKEEFQDGTNKTTAELIELFSSIKIHENDKLPQKICSSCRDNLIETYKFKLKIIETDIHLRNLVENVKNENSMEPFENHLSEYVEVKNEIEDDPITTTVHECTKCQKTFSSKKQLEIHKNQSHQEPTSEKFKCFTCDRSFESAESLRQHESKKRMGMCSRMATRTSKKCYFCGKTCKTFRSKYQHLEKEHRNIEKKCIHCSYETPSIKCFEQHVWSHQLGFDSFCHECGKNLRSRHGLLDHYRAVHLNLKQYSCDLCGLSFKIRSGILRHMKEKHLNFKNYRCDICVFEDVRFPRQTGLTQHKIDYHNFDTGISCLECNQKFISKSRMERHVKLGRCKGKKFIQLGNGQATTNCKICNKELSTFSGLKRHMRIHT